jgi:hypothetical protein
LTVAVVSVTLASQLTANAFILIAISVYSSSASYYSVLFIYTLAAEQRDQRTAKGARWRESTVRPAHTLLFELGSAELVDNLLFSPLLLTFACTYYRINSLRLS